MATSSDLAREIESSSAVLCHRSHWLTSAVVSASAVLLAASLMPWAMGFNTAAYFLGALALGAAFTALSVAFLVRRDRNSARTLFFASILYLPLLLGLVVATQK